MEDTAPGTVPYPLHFSVAYPDRELDRFSTAFRAIFSVPILIVLMSVYGGFHQTEGDDAARFAIGAGGLLFMGPLLMILFRQKYPRWWFDWNLELLRFGNRVWAYVLLMDDRYPSTDEHQGVELDVPYPDVEGELNRWLPLVKWLLAFPHYVVLIFLWIASFVATLVAWFVILFTGRYPPGVFAFNEGVLRWGNRVAAYALILTTDEYPPFRLG